MLKIFPNAQDISVKKLIEHLRVPLYRNAYALMINTVGTSTLGLIYWVFAARYYPPEVVGRDAAIISAMIFLSGVAQFDLMNVIIRFTPKAGGETGRLVRFSYLFSVFVSAIISIVVISFSIGSLFFDLADNEAAFNLWFVLACLASCVFLLQDSVLNGLGQSIWVPVENISYGILKIVLLFVFATSFPRHGIFASWTIPMFAALLPVNFLIFRWLIPRHVRTTKNQAEPLVLRKIIKYGTGNYLGSLFNLAALRILPLIVTFSLGPSANAYFYLPWTIVISLKLASANMATSLTVEGAKGQKDFSNKSYRFLVHMVQLYIPVIAVLIIGAPFILRISGGNYAQEGTNLLRLLAISALPNIVSTFYIGIARVYQRVTTIVIIQALYCVLILGLSYILLPIYGITGVGISLLVTEILVALAVVRPVLRVRSARRSIPALEDSPSSIESSGNSLGFVTNRKNEG